MTACSEKEPFYRVVLKEELGRRCRTNPRYSLRAFARSLSTDIGYLSRILNGQRRPSLRRATSWAQSLCLSEAQNQLFLSSISRDRSNTEMKKAGASAAPAENDQPAYLANEIFDVIGDLYHLAILELSDTENFRSSPTYVAKALGLSIIEARLAIDRLRRVGLLKVEDGRYVQTHASTTTKDKEATSAALRRHQRQILERAINSLMHDALEKRCMSGMTIAIDPARLPLAKKMIQNFVEELGEALESPNKQRVYQLGISFFPLQKEEA